MADFIGVDFDPKHPQDEYDCAIKGALEDGATMMITKMKSGRHMIGFVDSGVATEIMRRNRHVLDVKRDGDEAKRVNDTEAAASANPT